jgi:hypothetical protein
VAVCCLGFVLLVWLARPEAADRAVLGGASTGVVAVALALAVVGAGTAYGSGSTGLRRLVAVLVLVGWAGVVFLAGGNLFGADQPADVGLGLLLRGAAIGMGGLLVLLLRRGT